MKIFPNIKSTKIYARSFGLLKNWKECVVGVWHYLKLLFSRVPENTVLLVEMNKFHGECIPSYVKYFRDLGFQVVVISRYINYNNSSYCLFNVPPIRYCLTVIGMVLYLRSSKIRSYKYVLLTSNYINLEEYCYNGKILDFLKKHPVGEYGFGIIEHSLTEAYYSESEDSEKRLKILFENAFVLTSFHFKGRSIPMLNPHYFGEVNTKRELNRSKKVFITVGKVGNNTRAYSLLIQFEKFLIDDFNYEIRIIGNNSKKEIPEKLLPKVKLLGRVGYDEMYRNLKEADFFLPLLDPEKNELYLKYCTTGSRQLILGFNIISLMQKKFADHYGFSSENTIVYDNDFASAIMKALTMTNEEYQKMKLDLERVRKDVESVSLKNLRERLNNDIL